MDATVTITALEYEDLIDDQKLLIELYQAGLTGWDGYDAVIEEHNGTNIEVKNETN